MDAKFSKNVSIGLPPQIKTARNSLVELVLLILVCGLFGWFVVLPKNAEVNEKKIELAKVSDAQNKTDDELDRLKAAIRVLQNSQDKIDRLDQALPLDGKTIRLKVLLDALANSSGALVGDVSVSSNKGDAVVAGDKTLLAKPYGVTRSLQKLTGAIYVTGTFPQLKAFLQKLETSARLLDISDISLDGAPDGSLNLKVTLTAYYLSP